MLENLTLACGITISIDTDKLQSIAVFQPRTDGVDGRKCDGCHFDHSQGQFKLQEKNSQRLCRLDHAPVAK